MGSEMCIRDRARRCHGFAGHHKSHGRPVRDGRSILLWSEAATDMADLGYRTYRVVTDVGGGDSRRIDLGEFGNFG